ncbi:MAG: BBP7 family outer membrane beta-barrel protein [Gemmataceae bacterium]|nr:BBP7 family outer membrane beta-barrel protein [Gemmataceae bacterium]
MRNTPLIVMLLLVPGLAHAQGQIGPALYVPAGDVGLGQAPARLVRPAPMPPPASLGPPDSAPIIQAIEPPPEPPPGPAPLGRAWQRMEYLLWWIKDTRVPPLATANTSGTTAANLDSDTTVVLVGGDLDNQERSGGRFTVGFALDPAQTIGLEGTYFFLGTRTTTVGPHSTGAPGTPALGVPFFDLTTGTEQSILAAFPGFASGNVAVSSSARVQGFEVNAVASLFTRSALQLDGLVGFRFLQVNEGLQIAYASERFAASDGSVMRLGSADQFDGHNRFYGAQVGLRAELRKGPVFVSLAGKVALGDAVQVVRVNGISRLAPSTGGATVRPGGIFALPSNSGRFERDVFAVVPEGSMRLGVFLNPATRLYVGYDFLYLSEAARPGEQIDRRLNPTQVPVFTRSGTLVGTPRPRFAFGDSDFWVQGLVLGLEYRY